jgi:hypothetical protein
MVVNDRNMQQNNILIKVTDFVDNLSIIIYLLKVKTVVIDGHIYILYEHLVHTCFGKQRRRPHLHQLNRIPWYTPTTLHVKSRDTHMV